MPVEITFVLTPAGFTVVLFLLNKLTADKSINKPNPIKNQPPIPKNDGNKSTERL